MHGTADSFGENTRDEELKRMVEFLRVIYRDSPLARELIHLLHGGVTLLLRA